ncbi:hypothetical protein [Caulobacter sp.]|uniref:hypothetical protein n=1 Tax=Caulobacter sp. TaxID=78 RepID=UPI003BACFA70
MTLYTMVLDFHGGTYITQFDADSPVDAVTAWCGELQEEQLLGEVSSDIAEGIMIDAVENRLVEVEGLHNVWCAATTAGGPLALLNVIETHASPA